jgi:hypothetical protein
MHRTEGGCNNFTPHQGDPDFESKQHDDAGFFREVEVDSAAARLQETFKDPLFNNPHIDESSLTHVEAHGLADRLVDQAGGWAGRYGTRVHVIYILVL